MEKGAETVELLREILNLILDLLCNSATGEVSDEDFRQLQGVLYLLRQIKRDQTVSKSNRGRKKDLRPYQVVPTPDKKLYFVLILSYIQDLGLLSKLYLDGDIKVMTNAEESIAYLYKKIFGEELENPNQVVAEALKLDTPLKAIRKAINNDDNVLKRRKNPK